MERRLWHFDDLCRVFRVVFGTFIHITVLRPMVILIRCHMSSIIHGDAPQVKDVTSNFSTMEAG